MEENFGDKEEQILSKRRKYDFFPEVNETINYHYVWIRNLSFLLSTQLSKAHGKKHFTLFYITAEIKETRRRLFQYQKI